jgi:TolB-like protein/DNA-binding winged helix-turn-helix (wHTH) protein/Tfp pilus assembly protein PilF
MGRFDERVGEIVVPVQPNDSEDFRLGHWLVQPRLGRISSADDEQRLEPRVMALLVALARDPGNLVSKEHLIDEVWQVEAVAEGSLSHAIAELRGALGDDAKTPFYIETIYGRGYRLLCTPEWDGNRSSPFLETPSTSVRAAAGDRRRRLAAVAGFALAAAAAGLVTWFWHSTPPHPDIRSLAVLPLANLTGDPEQAIFVDGMHEALIGELASIRSLGVTSRTSVLQYRDTTATILQIAADLGVDAVIEGSVMRDGNWVSVTVQLIDGHNDRHLWHASFERDLHDVLRLRSEVARAIADEIRVSLTPEEEATLANAPSVEPEAYDFYLRGEHHASQINLAAAIGDFQKSIDIDPSFASAWGGLALATCVQITWIGGNAEPALVIPTAERAARRALALDATQVDAHLTLAYITGYYYWRWQEAESWFRRTLDIKKTESAQVIFANFLIWMDRCEEAEPIAREAVRSNPLSPVATNELAWVMIRQGKTAEGERLARRALDLDPHFPQSRMLYTRFLVEIGRVNEGLAMAESLVEEMPGNTDALFFAARAFVAAGREDRARSILSELEARSESTYISPGMLFELNLVLGEIDRALDLLERAYEVHDPWMIRLNMKKGNPPFDPIRHHPRFMAVMQKIAFPTPR